MAIIGIVAIAKNFAIGKGGKLPWHHSADLKFFKETTTGNAIVMGANTYRSIGKPLPDRLNIVLSRNSSIEPVPEVLRLSEKREEGKVKSASMERLRVRSQYVPDEPTEAYDRDPDDRHFDRSRHTVVLYRRTVADRTGGFCDRLDLAIHRPLFRGQTA